MEAREPDPERRIVVWATWLAAGFNAAAAAVLWSFLRLYAQDAPIPWWTPWVAVACALESTAVQAAIEWLKLPRLVRAAEGALLLSGIYLAAGGGRLLPGTNLAEWAATHEGAGALAVYAAGFVWASSASMAARVASLGPSSAYDLAARRMGAAAYVERRLFVALVAVILFAAVAEQGFPGRLFAPAAAPLRATLAAGVAALLACGLLLLGLLSLLGAQSAWAGEGISISRQLPREWIRGAAYTVAACVGLALALPGGWAFLSFGELLGGVSLAVTRFLQAVTTGFFTGVMNRGSTLPPQPARGTARPVAGAPPPGTGPGGEVAFMAVQILAALLVIALGAIGAAFLIVKTASFVRGEKERLPSLRELPLRFGLWLWRVVLRLAALFRRSLERVQASVSALWRALGQPRGGRTVPEEAEEEAPSAPALFVRYLFGKLLAAAARQGLPRRRSETAAEFGRRLKGEMEGVAASLDHLVEAYARARYSRGPLADAVKDPARAAWRRVLEALRSRAR